ncbi:MAG: DUF2249 domain-containing protein [Dehalococcoidia bacterium]|nr:DUF2249 domain-containing protein [Dehalococcoidia bacterium]
MAQEYRLDVRSLLIPQRFPTIFGKLGELAEGDSLLLINDFEPAPLFSELKSRGYSYESHQIGQSEWHIKIIKSSS